MKKKIYRKVQIGSFWYKPDYIEKIYDEYLVVIINNTEFKLQSSQKILCTKTKKKLISTLTLEDTILLDGIECKITKITKMSEKLDFYNIKKSNKFHGTGCYINGKADFYTSYLSLTAHSFEECTNNISEIFNL